MNKNILHKKVTFFLFNITREILILPTKSIIRKMYLSWSPIPIVSREVLYIE